MHQCGCPDTLLAVKSVATGSQRGHYILQWAVILWGLHKRNAASPILKSRLGSPSPLQTFANDNTCPVLLAFFIGCRASFLLLALSPFPFWHTHTHTHTQCFLGPFYIHKQSSRRRVNSYILARDANPHPHRSYSENMSCSILHSYHLQAINPPTHLSSANQCYVKWTSLTRRHAYIDCGCSTKMILFADTIAAHVGALNTRHMKKTLLAGVIGINNTFSMRQMVLKH